MEQMKYSVISTQKRMYNVLWGSALVVAVADREEATCTDR